MDISKDAVELTFENAKNAYKTVNTFLAASPSDVIADEKKTDAALAQIMAFTRTHSTHASKLSRGVAVAKMLDLKGKPLEQLFTALTGIAVPVSA